MRAQVDCYRFASVTEGRGGTSKKLVADWSVVVGEHVHAITSARFSKALAASQVQRLTYHLFTFLLTFLLIHSFRRAARPCAAVEPLRLHLRSVPRSSITSCSPSARSFFANFLSNLLTYLLIRRSITSCSPSARSSASARTAPYDRRSGYSTPHAAASRTQRRAPSRARMYTIYL